MIMAGPKKETTQMYPARSSIGNQGWIRSWREGPDNQLYHQNFQLSNLSCPRVPARILKSKSCENPKKLSHKTPSSLVTEGKLPPQNVLWMMDAPCYQCHLLCRAETSRMFSGKQLLAPQVFCTRLVHCWQCI